MINIVWRIKLKQNPNYIYEIDKKSITNELIDYIINMDIDLNLDKNNILKKNIYFITRKIKNKEIDNILPFIEYINYNSSDLTEIIKYIILNTTYKDLISLIKLYPKMFINSKIKLDENFIPSNYREKIAVLINPDFIYTDIPEYIRHDNLSLAVKYLEVDINFYNLEVLLKNNPKYQNELKSYALDIIIKDLDNKHVYLDKFKDYLLDYLETSTKQVKNKIYPYIMNKDNILDYYNVYCKFLEYNILLVNKYLLDENIVNENTFKSLSKLDYNTKLKILAKYKRHTKTNQNFNNLLDIFNNSVDEELIKYLVKIKYNFDNNSNKNIINYLKHNPKEIVYLISNSRMDVDYLYDLNLPLVTKKYIYENLESYTSKILKYLNSIKLELTINNYDPESIPKNENIYYDVKNIDKINNLLLSINKYNGTVNLIMYKENKEFINSLYKYNLTINVICNY